MSTLSKKTIEIEVEVPDEKDYFSLLLTQRPDGVTSCQYDGPGGGESCDVSGLGKEALQAAETLRKLMLEYVRAERMK